MMETDKAKIFIGGMSRETSEEALRSYFSKYGRVVTSLVAKDRVSGLSRGFGFVSFSDSSFADKALHDSHVILGKKVDVKKAIPRNDHGQCHQQGQYHQHTSRTMSGNDEGNGNGDGNELKTKKIFVGGLPSNLTEDLFKNYFERFGKIVDVVVMQDNLTNRPRGFGFVTFDSEESVDKAVEKSFHELAGKTVEVKKAVPKEDINSSYISEGSARGLFRNCSEPAYGHGYGIPPGYVPVTPYGAHSYGTGVFGSYPMVSYSRPLASFPFRHYGPMMFPSPYNRPPFFCPAYISGGSCSLTHAMVRSNGNVKITDISGGNGRQASEATLPPVEGKYGDDSSSMKGSENGVAC